jgi:hypothetical protein
VSNIIYADVPVLPLYLSILNRYWIVCVVFRFLRFLPSSPRPPSGMKDENMENEGFIVLVGYIFFGSWFCGDNLRCYGLFCSHDPNQKKCC